MFVKICRCCGGKLVCASASNPNVCTDCERWLLDESPQLAAKAERIAEAPSRAITPEFASMVDSFLPN